MRRRPAAALALALLASPAAAQPTEKPLIELAKHGWTEPAAVRALLAQGADPNVAGNYDQMTPLRGAIQSGSLRIVRVLVAGGADVNLRRIGRTPLWEAVGDAPRDDIVQFLLNAGADPNIADSWGKSPLSQAIMRRNYEQSLMLPAAGANVNAKDKTARRS